MTTRAWHPGWGFALLLLAPGPALGQAALRTANGPAAILPSESGGLSLDFNEAKLTATFLKSTRTLPEKPSTYRWLFNLSAAAQKGRREIFSGGNFNPEVAGDFTFMYTSESGQDAARSSFMRYFVTVSGAIERQKYVETGGGTVISYGTRTARAFSGTIGADIGFTEDNILGLAVTMVRRANSLTGFDVRKFCLTEVTMAGSNGLPVTVEKCDDRFVGAARDVTGGQVRFDWMQKLVVPSDPGTRNHPTVGLLVSGSADLLRGSRSRYNAALGPTLHPLGDPGGLYAAVLFEWADVTNTTSKEFEDRFFIRLYARVPVTF